MAGAMIVLGRRIVAVQARGSWPAFSLAPRNLCSGAGDGRYAHPHPNAFVAGSQEGGEPWPPPTQGGFVAETYPGQDHQQSPESYVPVTQGGFVAGNVDYNSYQAQPQAPPPPGYAPTTGYPYPYVQYPHAAPPPPPPPQVPYPQQYVGENQWASYHQTGYPYGQDPYVYPQQYTPPGYTPHVAPPPPPPSYVNPAHESFPGWTPANAPAVVPPGIEAQEPAENPPEVVEGGNPEVEVVSQEVEQASLQVSEASAGETRELREPDSSDESSPAAGGDEVEAAAAAASESEHGEEEEEEDATAAAMAEIGGSSRGEVDEDGGEKAEVVAAAEGREEEEEEPVKGPQSLLDVETSKAKPAPPPQSESFLDILSKTNMNRQARPRPPQLTLRSNNSRKTYARLHNLPRQILKSDLVNYFSEINLQKENIHIAYDEKFYPLYAQIAFDSSEAMRDAHKILQTKGRFGGRIVRWEQFIQFMPPGHSQISESMKNYLGRMLLMLHLPPEGRLEDVERFFESYGYDPSALSMLEPINMTLARFPKEGNRSVRRAAIGFFSSLEAMRALRERQGDFILNEPVELRLIQ